VGSVTRDDQAIKLPSSAVMESPISRTSFSLFSFAAMLRSIFSWATGAGLEGQPRRSMMVALAMPPPSHMVWRP
jgi:hypothetical protein